MSSQEFFGGYMKKLSLLILFLSSCSFLSLYCMEEQIVHRRNPFQQPALPVLSQAQQIQFDQRIVAFHAQIQATQQANVLPNISSEQLSQMHHQAIEASLSQEINTLILISNQAIETYNQGFRTPDLGDIFRILFNRFNLICDPNGFRQGLNIHAQRSAKRMSLCLFGYIRNLQ